MVWITCGLLKSLLRHYFHPSLCPLSVMMVMEKVYFLLATHHYSLNGMVISYAPLDRLDFTGRPDFSNTFNMDLFDARTSAMNP